MIPSPLHARLPALLASILLSSSLAAADNFIYQDTSLDPGWDNWSWGTTIDQNYTTNPYQGSSCLQFEIGAWGAFSVHPTTPVTTSDYQGLVFYLRTDGASYNLKIGLEDDATKTKSGDISLMDEIHVEGGAFSAEWKKVVVPFSSFASVPEQITRINIGNGSSDNIGPFYIDDFALSDSLTYDLQPLTVQANGSRHLRMVTNFPVDASLGGSFELRSATDGDYTVAQTLALTATQAPSVYNTLSLPASLKAGHSYSLTVSGLKGGEGVGQTQTYETQLAVGGETLTLTVESATPTHAISPYIYGMAFAPDPDYIRKAGVTVNRWGGNHTSPYNWKEQVSNRGNDWYFTNHHETNVPIDYIETNARSGAATQWSLTCLPWLAKDDHSYSFSVAKYGAQKESEPWHPDIGRGVYPDGTRVANDPRDSLVPNRPFKSEGDPEDAVYQDEFLRHLGNHFGQSIERLVPFIATDNEMDIWDGTHADAVHEKMGFADVRDTFLTWAKMIKKEMPHAQVFGPVSTGWYFYWNAAKGGEKSKYGMGHIPWILKEIKAHDDAYGMRTLDVLDLHFYPDSGNGKHELDPQDKHAWRLRSTREWWDPTYRGEGSVGRDSWHASGEPNPYYPQVLRRMKGHIDTLYPGTKLAITEWNFGNSKSYDMSQGLAVADTLGIFGREDLFYSTFWTNPYSDAPIFQAYALFRNPGELGDSFGSLSLPAQSIDQDKVSIYAALDNTGHKLHVVLINKQPVESTEVNLTLPSLAFDGPPTAYRFDNTATDHVYRAPDSEFSGHAWRSILPPYSATHILFPLIPSDSDSDGMTDVWETAFGLDPDLDDAGVDSDLDGYTNLEEFQYGSHPLKREEFPFTRIERRAVSIRAAFFAPYDRTLQLQRSSDLVNWETLQSYPGSGGLIEIEVFDSRANASHYRLSSRE